MQRNTKEKTVDTCFPQNDPFTWLCLRWAPFGTIFWRVAFLNGIHWLNQTDAGCGIFFHVALFEKNLSVVRRWSLHLRSARYGSRRSELPWRGGGPRACDMASQIRSMILGTCWNFNPLVFFLGKHCFPVVLIHWCVCVCFFLFKGTTLVRCCFWWFEVLKGNQKYNPLYDPSSDICGFEEVEPP